MTYCVGELARAGKMADENRVFGYRDYESADGAFTGFQLGFERDRTYRPVYRITGKVYGNDYTLTIGKKIGNGTYGKIYDVHSSPYVEHNLVLKYISIDMNDAFEPGKYYRDQYRGAFLVWLQFVPMCYGELPGIPCRPMQVRSCSKTFQYHPTLCTHTC